MMCHFDAPMNKIQKLVELWNARPLRVEPDNDDHLIYVFTGLLPALREAMSGIVEMSQQSNFQNSGVPVPRENADNCKAEPGVPKLASLEPFDCGTNGTARAKPKQICGRKPEHLPDDLLNLLPPVGLKNAIWVACASGKGISRRTFFRLRKMLEQTGKVERCPVTNQWEPTV